jgi:hypothetical protein
MFIESAASTTNGIVKVLPDCLRRCRCPPPRRELCTSGHPVDVSTVLGDGPIPGKKFIALYETDDRILRGR